MRHRTCLFGPGFLFGICFNLTGCSSSPPEAPGTLRPTVTVSYPLQRQVRDYEEYTGRTAAIESVQIRARVNGYLEKINFQEGAEVKEGAVLYEIDPRPYKAVLDQAEAQVRLQEANLKFQEAEYKRTSNLLRAGRAASQEDVEKTLAARDTARASVNAAKANVEQARLNLEFTKVLAPVSGLLSRALITRGNLVVADQTLLTTIVSMDPMYAYFDVDEQTMLHVQQLIRQGKVKSAREPGVKVPVLLGLASEHGFPQEGYVDFVNNQVDPSTGTLQIRGIFPNPKPPVGGRLLTPGLFVRIRVAIGTPYQAILINERALGSDQDVKYVYVVNNQDQVVRRDLKLGSDQDGLRVIAEGLTPNERVIVSGIQRVLPGIVVTPKLEDMPIPPRAAKPAKKKGENETGKPGEKDKS
jgi:RND family efflux transporter MFP subunit